MQLSTITAASLRGHSDSSYQSRARYCGPRARILCGKATIVAEGRISLVERGQVTVALWSPDRPHRAASGRGAASSAAPWRRRRCRCPQRRPARCRRCSGSRTSAGRAASGRVRAGQRHRLVVGAEGHHRPAVAVARPVAGARPRCGAPADAGRRIPAERDVADQGFRPTLLKCRPSITPDNGCASCPGASACPRTSCGNPRHE